MAEPTDTRESKQPASAGGRYQRHSSTTGLAEPKARKTSGFRRSSLSQGLKEGGQKVASAVGGAVDAVGALFKDKRGELLDPDDNPEFVRNQPAWEDDLNKYLPESQIYTQPWNASTSSAAGPSTSSQPIPSGFENVASTSSKPPMIPTEGTSNSALDLLFGGKSKQPRSLAAYRWHKAYQFVKKQNAMKRKAMSSPLGTGAKLDGHAFGIIPTDDENRRSIFNFWYQSNAEYWLACIIAGHIIVLILKAEYKFVTPYIPPKKSLNGADIALTTLYTVEVLSRIFCLGFWHEGPHTYLRNPFNKLDFVIVVDSWVHIARTCILGKDAFCRIAVLRVFRILLSMRHLRFIGNVLAIMDSITKSALQLRTIFVFTIMVMSFYSLMGVLYLGGAMKNRCIRITDNLISYPERTCILNSMDPYGYLCPAELDQYCQPYINPNWGISSFDNYGSGMLILFQMLTFEGWALQMYTLNDTNGYANAFYMVFVVIGSYFLVNIYIAAISSMFLRVRHEHQALLKKHRRDKEFTFAAAIQMANLLKDIIIKEDANVKLTWRQRLSVGTAMGIEKFRKTLTRQGTRLQRNFSSVVDWNNPNSYLKRISTFGAMSGTDAVELEETAQSSSGPESLGRSLSRNLSLRGQQVARLGRTFSRNLSLTMIFAAQTTSQKCYIIVESKLFMYAVLLLLSLNMAGMCTYRATMSHLHQTRLEILEIGMLIIFSGEMVLRFIAAGSLTSFADERMNILDTLVIVLSFGATGFGRHKKYPNLTPIRMLRWFYKKNSHNEDLGEDTPIVVAIIRSFGSLASVFFFFTLITLVYSIISMELWGGQFSNFDDGYPRANHDTIFQAMLLWFSVTTAESWPDHMWNTMRPGMPYQYMGPILFISFYVTTAIVTLNLIMAVILEQTELTDNQKKFIQKRDHIKWLQSKHSHHVSSTRGSDWLVDAVHHAHKGYEGVKKRMSTMKVSRVSLFPVFQSETGFVRMMSSPQAAHLSSASGLLPRTNLQAPLAQISESKPASSPKIRRYSFGSPTAPIPGSVEEPQGEDRGKGRIFRRSSLSALNTVSDLMTSGGTRSKLSRSASHNAEKVVLRSGFGKMKPVAEGENRTALQTALMNVVEEQKEFSRIEGQIANELATKMAEAASAAASVPSKPVDPRLEHPILGKMPSRRNKKDKGDRISFALADYEAIKPEGEMKVPWWMSEPSLFIFRADNRFRIFCNKVAENTYYLYWQYIIIWMSLWVVVEKTQLGWYLIWFEHPIYMDALDYLVFAVFALDFLIKVVAYGFLFTPEAYLGDPFNFIDVFSLIMHICKLQEHTLGTWYNTLLLLSTTRPARFVVRSPGLRTLTISIFRTMPAIGQMLVFTVVIYAIFAVIGMQLYANRFRHCTDNSVTGHFDCVGYFYNDVGIIAPRIWENPPYHFDDFGEAMLSLFVLSTFDNWLDYFAYTAMDIAHHHELQPQRNGSPAHIIYFVSFICVGGFFILRIFIGIFIDQFGLISGSKLLTERQKLWRDTNRILQSLKPTRLPAHPKGAIRGFCYRVVHSRKFEFLIVFVILVNYSYIAYQHYGNESITVHFQQLMDFENIEAMFVSLYLLEALIKFLGTKFSDWWHHSWNLVELVMVIVSASCLFPDNDLRTYRTNTGGFFYVIRIFRVIRYIPQLSSMAATVLISLPNMVDIVALMGIVLFLFAGIGNNLFTNLKNGSCYGDNVSFNRFTTSFVVLFQITTLDNWSCLIRDMSVQQPSCTFGVSLYTSDCGYPQGAIVYLVVLVCVTSHIFANLFVAQIIDSITFGLLDENAMITPRHLYQYQHLWATKEFDFNATGYIGHHKLREFVNILGPPLGRRLTFHKKWIAGIEYEAFNFRSSKGIPFRSLLETLVLYKIGPKGLELPLRIERERQVQQLYRVGAAMKIQALARGYLQRKGFYKDQKVEDANIPKRTRSNSSNSKRFGSRILRTLSSFGRR